MEQEAIANGGEAMTPQEKLAQDLRELAHLIESHPEMPMPDYVQVDYFSGNVSANFHAVRSVFGGEIELKDNDLIYSVRTFGLVKVRAIARQKQVMQPHTVTREVVEYVLADTESL